jgi:sulfate transport system substrate-binding protein
MNPFVKASLVSLFASLALAACSGSDDVTRTTASSAPRERVLTLGAYTTPREVYGKEILPAFKAHWLKEKGETVRFEESYLGSGAQSRAIVGGFEADVAALSLEADIDRIVQAGLITHDWKAGPAKGMVTRSVVVLCVREGNPKSIRDWDDIAQSNLAVLTPNPKTSGGAMWNISALYGAAMRGKTSAPAGDAAASGDLLGRVLRNVTIMDKGARESMITFETGVGDVAITYENEVLVGRMGGKTYEYVVPTSTILIENPIAVVDQYAQKHGNLELANAFVEFLARPESQRACARYGLRPVDPAIESETKKEFPPVTDLFTIRDIGGWPEVTKTVFGTDGVFERASTLAGKAQ